MKPYSDFATVPALVQVRAGDSPDALAVSFEGTSLTYAELEDGAARVHGWLQAAGVAPGDRVALLLRNSLEFFHAWLGVARGGMIAVPINTAMVGDALAYTLAHSEAVAVIADGDLLATVDAAGEFPDLRLRLAVGATEPAGSEAFAAIQSADPVPALAPGAITGGTPMSIVYTSGTTGMPKGVVLPHQSFTNTGAYFARHLGLDAHDRIHTCLPLFHCNAQQCGFMAAAHLGVPFFVNAKFSVSRFWTWIEETGATVSNLMGAMLTLLYKVDPKPSDDENTLRMIPAAPIPEDLYEAFQQRFGVQLVEGYGLTETATMAIINPVDDMRPGTIGLPLEHNRVKVVDEHDEEVPAETPGEIVVRGEIPDSQMLGYFKEPEKTAEAMRGGWFHTGDMGKRREDGYFVFLDRMKDTIRRRGENISSFLIEKSVLEHPKLLECAVFGVPSELSEEDVKLVAVVRPGAELDPQELVDWCAARMADFMVPRYVEFVADVPLTETGRVHKFKLREAGIGDAWDRERAGARH
ncbi:MAG: AMP-binding protein [Actinobacteria bacterium]|nr:AMP-binding protein [Actinomycetota bacterium]